MADFKDISEFSLKPLLDGQEEIQISAEYKTTLLRIAKLVISELFTLDTFGKITEGFGPLSSSDTLIQALKKVDLGFSNGSMRFFWGGSSDTYAGFIVQGVGIVGFNLDTAGSLYILERGSSEGVDITSDDDIIADLLEQEGEGWDLRAFVKEILADVSLSSLTLTGGQVVWATNFSSISIQASSFIRANSSAVVGGSTKTTAPTITVPSGWKLYKASNWDSIWSLSGMKVITIQRFSQTSNILVANVGLYLEA